MISYDFSDKKISTLYLKISKFFQLKPINYTTN